MNGLYGSRSLEKPKAADQRLRAYTALLAFLPVGSLLLAFGMEAIERGSFGDAVEWAMNNGALFALNALLCAMVLLLACALVGSLLPAMSLAALVLFGAALISFIKGKMIGLPLFPWDILLRKEGLNIAPLVSSSSMLMRVSAVGAVVVGLLALGLLLPKLRLPWAARVICGLLAVLSLHAMIERVPAAQRLYDRAGVYETVWNQSDNYRANGFGVAFTLNVRNAIVPKPPNYGEEAIATVAQLIADKRSASGLTPREDRPNVIFIMNEAFWDPTLLPNVTFSEDPMPTFRRLQQEGTSGYLLSPQYGGGTSNVEFEVLTGQSMSLLPNGSVPYQQYIRQPVPSLASYFDDLGYKSIGIHSYDGWFWNRDSVYRWLGFESFKSKEKFDAPEYKGAFISDAEVSRSIIQASQESDRPLFVYAVTMQNHGAYDDNRYDFSPVQVEGELTPEAKHMLENYTHGIYDADRSLQQLIDYFEASGEPTVIVFFGDHLPMLGADYDVYKQAGFVGAGSWSLEELKRMYSVPFAMWSNFDLEPEQVPVMSNSFLGAYVLHRLDLELPANFAYGLNLLEEIPGMINGLVVDAEQNLYPFVPDWLAPLVESYRELQYDLLFGDRHLAAFIDADYLSKAALDHYNLEFELSHSADSLEAADTEEVTDAELDLDESADVYPAGSDFPSEEAA